MSCNNYSPVNVKPPVIPMLLGGPPVLLAVIETYHEAMPSNPASTNVSDQTSGIYLESPEADQCEVISPNS